MFVYTENLVVPSAVKTGIHNLNGHFLLPSLLPSLSPTLSPSLEFVCPQLGGQDGFKQGTPLHFSHAKTDGPTAFVLKGSNVRTGEVFFFFFFAGPYRHLFCPLPECRAARLSDRCVTLELAATSTLPPRWTGPHFCLRQRNRRCFDRVQTKKLTHKWECFEAFFFLRLICASPSSDC